MMATHIVAAAAFARLREAHPRDDLFQLMRRRETRFFSPSTRPSATWPTSCRSSAPKKTPRGSYLGPAYAPRARWSWSPRPCARSRLRSRARARAHRRRLHALRPQPLAVLPEPPRRVGLRTSPPREAPMSRLPLPCSRPAVRVVAAADRDAPAPAPRAAATAQHAAAPAAAPTPRPPSAASRWCPSSAPSARAAPFSWWPRPLRRCAP